MPVHDTVSVGVHGREAREGVLHTHEGLVGLVEVGPSAETVTVSRRDLTRGAVGLVVTIPPVLPEEVRLRGPLRHGPGVVGLGLRARGRS